MSLDINFSALINHVTNENHFYERHENSCDVTQKKIWVILYIWIQKYLNNKSNI